MKIPWQEAQEELPVPEGQYQERFWRRRLDGIGLDTVNREFLAIEFKRTQDMRSNYAEEATKVAQRQYSSLLEGLRAVGQVKGWQTQQIVFVGGTCGSVHVDSFNKNMKAIISLTMEQLHWQRPCATVRHSRHSSLKTIPFQPKDSGHCRG